MRPHFPTRRQAIGGIATLVGLTTGGLVITGLEQPARASVAVQDLSIPDREFSAPNGDLHAPWLAVDAQYQFSGVKDASEVVILLMVADEQIIELKRASVSAPDDSGTVTITGDVTAADAYAPSDFTSPTDGESVQVPITVTIMAQVRNSDGQTQVKATDSVEVVVTVTNEAATASTSVTVGGSGRVLFQNNESDAPPA